MKLEERLKAARLELAALADEGETNLFRRASPALEELLRASRAVLPISRAGQADGGWGALHRLEAALAACDSIP